MTESPYPSTDTYARPAAIAAGALLLAVLASSFAEPAMADLVDAYFAPGIIGREADTGVTVMTRERPATDPIGIHAGAFTIRPQIGLSPGYDSNPLLNNRPKGSHFFRTDGTVDFTTNSADEPLSARITFEDTRYASVRGLSVSLGKVFTFGSDRLSISATHLSLHQTGRDLNAPNLDAPGPYSITNVRLTYDADRGSFFIQPQLQYTGFRYEDVTSGGTRIAQTYRDRDVLDGQLTLKYKYAELRDVALVLRGASIHYVDPVPLKPREDSNTAAILVGIDNTASAPWRLRLLAGVQSRQGSGPGVKSRAAPTAEASVTYQPTGLTTIGASITRAVQDAAGEFAAAFTYTEAKIAIDHELTRDILLHAGYGIQRAEYEQSGGSETLNTAQAAVTWLVNRNARVTGSYTYLAKKAATGGSLSESVAMIRLQLGI